MPAIKSSESARLSSRPVLAAFLLLACWSAAAVLFFYRQGSLLDYGDAEAHLNIARRIVDSRTPGYDQVGTVWLPLLHILLIPFARVDHLWQSGLAAAFPSACAFVLAGTFLFAAVRRAFRSDAAAGAAVALFALNPNLMCLQSSAMTEPLFLAALMAALYFTVRFGQTRGWGALLGAALAMLAGTLARYEAWFLIPFLTLYILVSAREQRLLKAALFGVVAVLGPLYWLGHNWWYFGNALAFYSDPIYSAKAIQGQAAYPGKGDWATAWLYFRTAARLACGLPLLALAVAGALAAILRRVLWPLLLLALPPAFYIWSIHSAATPIFVPPLPPHSYYNTRYGLAALPLAVFAAAALVALVPLRARRVAALLAVAAASAVWLVPPRPANWIVWQEGHSNDAGRRELIRQAAGYLQPRYHPGEGIISTSELYGVFRVMGLPFREVLTNDNWPLWPAAVARPDLFLWEDWAVVTGGDRVQTALNWGFRDGPRYHLEKTIIVKGAKVLEIYRRFTPPRSPGPPP